MASVSCLRLASMACSCSVIWSKVRPTRPRLLPGGKRVRQEIAVADPAGGLFELLQAAPVRAQPEQDRQPQRETDDQQQPHVDPVQFVQVGKIGHGADDQHLIGARNALQEGVILLDDDDVARLQKGLILVGQRLVGEGADLQWQGELAALLGHAGGPVLGGKRASSPVSRPREPCIIRSR